MKKKFIILIILFFIPLISTLGYSVWSVVGEINVKPKFNPNSLFYTYLNGQEVTYNGTAQGPVSTDPSLFSLIDGTYTVKYKKVGESKYTTGLPTDAGSYYLYFDHNNDDYTEPSDVLFVIEKATLDTVSITPVYNQSGKTGYFTTDMNTSDITFDATISNSVIGKIITEEDANLTLDATSLNVGLNVSYNYTVSGMTNYYDYTGTVSIDTYAIINLYKDNTIIKTIDVQPGNSIDPTLIPAAPIGYNYDSWFTDVEFNNSFDTSSVINTNINLYVKYSLITYYVYTYKDDNDFIEGIIFKQYSYTIESEDFSIDLPTLNNYYFKNWQISGENISSTLLKREYTITKGSYGNISCVGSWALIIKISSLDLSYDASVRSYSNISNSLLSIVNATTNSHLKYMDGTALSQTDIDSFITGFDGLTIKLMHNGYYYTGDTSYINDDENVESNTLKSMPSNVPGSTYLVTFALTNDSAPYVLYDSFSESYLYYDSNQSYGQYCRVLFKYKTATIDNFTSYLTIEDAISNSSTDMITFPGVADNSNYVLTSFSNLNSNFTKYSASSYTLNKKLRIPFAINDMDFHGSGGEDKVSKPTILGTTTTTTNGCDSPSVTAVNAVYSSLLIPFNVTLNINSGIEFVVGGLVTSSGKVYNRGVLLNDGLIVCNGNIKSYGYIKGNGTIELNSGADLLDVFTIYDWLGGGASAGLNNAKILAVSAFSIHNVSCKVKIFSGATYQAFWTIKFSNKLYGGYQRGDKNGNVKIIGSGGLFNLSSGYILKSASEAISKSTSTNLSNITGTNQEYGQKDIIGIYGTCVDGVVSLNISASGQSFNMSTSKELAIAISYMDVTIGNDNDGNIGNLTLTNSAYKFLPGTSLKIDDGATLTVESGVNLSFYTVDQCIIDEQNRNKPFIKSSGGYCVDKFDSYLIVNGTLNISATAGVGGIIYTTSSNGKIIVSSTAQNSNSVVYSSNLYVTSYTSGTLTDTYNTSTRNHNMMLCSYNYDTKEVDSTNYTSGLINTTYVSKVDGNIYSFGV